MKLRKTQPSETVKLLKKTDHYWSKPVLIRSNMVLAISIVAALVDGLSIHYSISPLLMGLAIMSYLVTIIFAAVLDIMPNYFTYGFTRIRELKNKQNEEDQIKLIKASMIGAGIVWAIVFAILCALRAVTAPVILEELIRHFAADKNSTFEITPLLQQLLMGFLDAANLGTSMLVLFAGIVSAKTPGEQAAAKALTDGYAFSKAKAEAQRKQKELETVANAKDDDIKAAVKDRVDNAIRQSSAQANCEKAYSREILNKSIGDPDVSGKVTESSRTLAQPTGIMSATQHQNPTRVATNNSQQVSAENAPSAALYQKPEASN